jgi:acetyl esterase/lipase
MRQDQLELLRSDSTASMGDYVRNKTDLDLRDPLHIAESPRAINMLTDEIDHRDSRFFIRKKSKIQAPKIHSGLSMTSRMSYFSDRILNPEFMRAMALMYLADSPIKPDIRTDYLLSPINTPDTLLAQFPKTYILAGEKDPLIDDSGIVKCLQSDFCCKTTRS